MRVLTGSLATAVLLALAVTTVPNGAAAAEPDRDFTRDGWYAQIQGVWALRDAKSSEDSWGINGLGGYRMGRNFAGEVEFEYVYDIGDLEAETYNLAFNLRLYPLGRLFAPSSNWNRVQPYVKAGLAWQWAQGRAPYFQFETGEIAGRFSGGLDFYLTDSVVLTTGVTYQLPNTGLEYLRYLSVGGGLQYRFGGE